VSRTSHDLSPSPDGSAGLALTRAKLLAAAPRAADVLTSGLEDNVSKEQIDSARDILDRVGVRKDVVPSGPSPDSVISDVAYGAFRALLAKFGVEMPSAPVPVDSTVVVQGLPGSAPLLPASPEVTTGPAPRRVKPRTDDFLVNLEEKNDAKDEDRRKSARVRASRPAKGRKAVDGGGLA
jgi:hypothetical protein